MRNDPTADVLPHDRVVFFSDALFAIAITLLVIEIKVPGHEVVASRGLGRTLASMLPLFIGYLVSFLVAALFWVGHMKTWRHVTRVTANLVWLNILELFFVALLPFSTGLYTEYFGNNLAFFLYCANLSAIALFSWWCRALVIRRERLHETLGRHHVQWLHAQTLIALLVFLACIPLALVAPVAARFGFVAIFVLQFAVRAYLYRRRPDPAADAG
jgi:uncharacterized membrane protein